MKNEASNFDRILKYLVIINFKICKNLTILNKNVSSSVKNNEGI